jgi:hypothetical protein
LQYLYLFYNLARQWSTTLTEAKLSLKSAYLFRNITVCQWLWKSLYSPCSFQYVLMAVIGINWEFLEERKSVLTVKGKCN